MILTMRIEKITQSKQPQVVFLCFDDETKLRVRASVVMDYGLYPGMELDEAQLADLTAGAKKASARARAVRMISAAATTEAALERKLVQKGEAAADARQAVQWLKDLHLLDDVQVARQLAEAAARKGYGPVRLRQILYEKQVPRQYWDEALALLPDMSGALDAFLQKRFAGCQPDRKERDRAAQALLRRGHRWDDVRAALDRYCASCGEQREENEDYEL